MDRDIGGGNYYLYYVRQWKVFALKMQDEKQDEITIQNTSIGYNYSTTNLYRYCSEFPMAGSYT